MSVAAARRRIQAFDYPSSDGEPMAETDVHRDEVVALIEALKRRYADRKDAYVAGNLLVYYEEGNPSARFAPDVMVVFGTVKRQRRTYKLWKEERPPSIVIEVTSRGTWLEDEGNKKALCARLGVAEYYLYDPLGECLAPPLQGFGLKDGVYVPLRRGAGGGFRSAVLGLKLVPEAGRLRLLDVASGEALLRPEEVESARQRAEAALRDAERRVEEEAGARRAAEARASAAEAEIARLRARVSGDGQPKKGRRGRGKVG